MNLEEFNKLMASNVEKAKKEAEELEIKRKRVKIEEEKRVASNDYYDLIDEKKVFYVYEEFIQKFLPDIIKDVIADNRSKLINDLNPEVLFRLVIVGSDSDIDYAIEDRALYVIYTSSKYALDRYIESFLNAYDIGYYESSYTTYDINTKIVDLFRAYTLEKEHGLDYLRKRINSSLEDYDDSLKIPEGPKIG